MKVINVLADGTELDEDEWKEYWKTHVVPYNSATAVFYHILANMPIKNSNPVTPEKVSDIAVNS